MTSVIDKIMYEVVLAELCAAEGELAAIQRQAMPVKQKVERLRKRLREIDQ